MRHISASYAAQAYRRGSANARRQFLRLCALRVYCMTCGQSHSLSGHGRAMDCTPMAVRRGVRAALHAAGCGRCALGRRRFRAEYFRFGAFGILLRALNGKEACGTGEEEGGGAGDVQKLR